MVYFCSGLLSNIKNTIFNPVMKDGKMISLNFSWSPSDDKTNVYSIEFRDSLLMLPNSLRKLAKAFHVDNKGIFPYKFTDVVDLDYIGEVPAFEYFSDISQEEYNVYKANFNKNWDLRSETIKYCELDCRVLWQIIDKFNNLIFDKYSLNIHRFPTLPSLAFGIFRGHYLIEDQIPKINGLMYHDIRKGYTGGHTDVYKPSGSNVSCYDVNSLYPFAMKTFAMPIGKITYFEGNILEFMKDAFGFFECEVTAPKDLDRPLLQTKVNTKSGFRTVAPLGNWTDMVFSEEINEYLKYGYQFKILRGYLFEKGFIFSDYVNDLYKIKQSVSKDDPMYAISKLLLNSLYGRFGMDYATLLSKHVVMYNVLSYQLLDKFIITDIIDLDMDQVLISYMPKDVEDQLSSEYFDNLNFNISISIAAAVTASARVHMSQFLGDKSLNVLYTDTDSIDIDKPLDPKFIGPELGLMKLECIFDEAVFLAPKVYGGLLENGNEITKVKGFKDEIKYSELKSLLVKDTNLELKQDKWFNSLQEGSITIKEQLYKLVPTDNKRQLIYFNNKLVNTKPFIIDENKSLVKK